MIKIEFEQKSKEEILIFGINVAGERKEIGRIFTPAGSGETDINSIQICGFDVAYDYWGCAVYGDKATGKMKKDIQLNWFGNYDKMNREEMNKIQVGSKMFKEGKGETGVNALIPIFKDRFSIEGDGACMKCFNRPCTCEVNILYDNPYLVKRSQDLTLYNKKDFDEAVKNAVINSLENKR